MIGIGTLVGVGLILLDTLLGAMKKLRIPPRAVGIGIYLPMSATFAVVVGAVISYCYSRRIHSAPNPERAERLGTLVASGLIVGESLWGVINAGLIVGTSNDAPIALVPADTTQKLPGVCAIGERNLRGLSPKHGICARPVAWSARFRWADRFVVLVDVAAVECARQLGCLIINIQHI